MQGRWKYKSSKNIKKMKANVLFMFVVILSFLTACQKEVFEDLPILPIVDKTVLQKEAAMEPVLNEVQISALTKAQKANGGVALTAAEVSQIIGLTTKNAAIPDPTIVVRLLDHRESIVTDNSLTRFTCCLRINENHDVDEMYTFSQTYPIVNGRVVYDSYFIFDFELDCPQNRHYSLTKVTNVWDVKYYFMADDKVNFSYNLPVFNGENGQHTVAIIPFENGKGVVQGINETLGNSPKIFETEAFDCYENASGYLYLTFSFYQSNIRSSIEIDQKVLEGVSYLVLRGEQDGEILKQYCDVLQTKQFQTLSFTATFDVSSVRICSRNGCYYYNTKYVREENGIKYYKLELE